MRPTVNTFVVLVSISILSLTYCKTIKVPGYEDPTARKSYVCTDTGFFPDVEDCQMFWFCELRKNNDPSEEYRENLFEPVRLFKCPKGYAFDENIKRCQPSENVKCIYPQNKKNEETLISPWGTMNDFR